MRLLGTWSASTAGIALRFGARTCPPSTVLPTLVYVPLGAKQTSEEEQEGGRQHLALRQHLVLHLLLWQHLLLHLLLRQHLVLREGHEEEEGGDEEEHTEDEASDRERAALKKRRSDNSKSNSSNHKKNRNSK